FACETVLAGIEEPSHAFCHPVLSKAVESTRTSILRRLPAHEEIELGGFPVVDLESRRAKLPNKLPFVLADFLDAFVRFLPRNPVLPTGGQVHHRRGSQCSVLRSEAFDLIGNQVIELPES